MSILTGEHITKILTDLGITHVVWIPDSTLGEWDSAFRAAESLQVINVCREGETWEIAAGLHLGGANPIVIIQCTGLFESGDSLRNVLHDYQIPIFAIIGYRSYLSQETLPGDTCLKFTEPILDAWNVDYRFIDTAEKVDQLEEHYRSCQQKQIPGVILLAEGKA